MSDLILEPEPEPLDCAAEPEPEPEPEPELDPDEPQPDPEPPVAAVSEVLPLVHVLPADFPLPALIRFVPDGRLLDACRESAAYALTVDVTGGDGLVQADAALTTVRGHMKAIEDHFAEPAEIANRLHKSLTSTRAQWLATGDEAVKTVGRRIYAEKSRLEALAAEERRKAQAEADRLAREEARKQAAAAEAAKAPKAVVENLKQQAEVAKAAPVATPSVFTPPKLAGTTITKNWIATIAGTPRDAEQQPDIVDLNPDQRLQIFAAMRAVLDGQAPLAMFAIDWGYIRKRAKADEATFNLPGFEAYDAGGTRAKSTRK